MAQLGGSPKCPVCDKNVYFAEEARAVGKIFHKMCLKCSQCKKMLDSTTVTDHDGALFCRGCYSKNFGPKGYGFAGGASGLSTDNGESTNQSNAGKGAVVAANPDIVTKFGGGGDICATCGKRVYANEKTDCSGKVFHKLCFKCKECGKLLEKGSVSEHANEIYCKGCYNKNFGTKGFVSGTSMHVN